ncbi:uncharacterized protein LOC120208088 isoform X1 [Hibiscus syriacus]|uniref:uncharacterized protein LOC120208088 isoform X1 n=1 Tax=Hibiscus syriacus TaxID=106335 RepID=UPI00192184F3|nr:uncharacterized protein LOC120208088 isoform X1 [Hibiscus syriacus]XP_039063378.1 uncharacterized protein LOC120208088 isoform X1 [Hibiscus syriacus]
MISSPASWLCFTENLNGCSWQIRSHAQKYFLKAQKNWTAEHVPPRPKRKAAHPYPQKAPKNVALYPKSKYRFNLHLHCLNMIIPTNQIHHLCSEIQLPSQLGLPGVMTLCRLSPCLKPLKMMLYFPDQIWHPTLVIVVVMKALRELGQLVKQLPEGIMGSNLEFCQIFLRCMLSLAVSLTPVQVGTSRN